jgi:hypothetical protein
MTVIERLFGQKPQCADVSARERSEDRRAAERMRQQLKELQRRFQAATGEHDDLEHARESR